MSAGGPLIRGIEEFDRPKRGVPGWLVATIVVVVAVLGIVFGAGFLAGAGPMASLGNVTETLQPVGYRPTTDAAAMQVALAVPAHGICPDDAVVVHATETSDVIEIRAELTRRRGASCEQASTGSATTWVDVTLNAPLGERTVVREGGSSALPRQTSGDIAG